MKASPIVRVLEWNAAFGPENNTSERAAKNIGDLCACLEDLARCADTADLMLKQTCPGEAASLGAAIGAAKSLLQTIRCETCKGFGRIGNLGGGSHVCADCSAPSVPEYDRGVVHGSNRS